jgi:hypothetical protein
MTCRTLKRDFIFIIVFTLVALLFYEKCLSIIIYIVYSDKGIH